MSYENFYDFFGMRLKSLRKEHDITQAEIADLLGVSATTITNYENGNRKMPIDMVVRIADRYPLAHLDHVPPKPRHINVLLAASPDSLPIM